MLGSRRPSRPRILRPPRRACISRRARLHSQPSRFLVSIAYQNANSVYLDSGERLFDLCMPRMHSVPFDDHSPCSLFACKDPSAQSVDITHRWETLTVFAAGRPSSADQKSPRCHSSRLLDYSVQTSATFPVGISRYTHLVVHDAASVPVSPSSK